MTGLVSLVSALALAEAAAPPSARGRFLAAFQHGFTSLEQEYLPPSRRSNPAR